MEKMYENKLLEAELKDNTIKQYLDKIHAINCMGYNIDYDIENKRTIISSVHQDVVPCYVSIPEEFIELYWQEDMGCWAIPSEIWDKEGN